MTTALAVECLLVYVLEKSMAFRVPDRPMVVFPHSVVLAWAHHPLDMGNGVSGNGHWTRVKTKVEKSLVSLEMR